MATVDNAAGRALLNVDRVPEKVGELRPYIPSIEGKLTIISVMARSKPNAEGKKISIQVQSAIAEKLKEALTEVYEKYPAYVVVYCGAYNFRPMNNSKQNAIQDKDQRLASNHSLGFAIDFNYYCDINGVSTKCNPYEKCSDGDDSYRMRTLNHPLVRALVSRGFSWGGTWSTPDYMHFEYAIGDFSSDIYVDPDTIGTSDSSGYSVTGSGGSASSAGMLAYNQASNIQTADNTVFQLASSGERTDVLKVNDARKEQFKSMRETLKSKLLNMGRQMIESPEMYNSSIMKSSQSAKQQRFGNKSNGTQTNATSAASEVKS